MRISKLRTIAATTAALGVGVAAVSLLGGGSASASSAPAAAKAPGSRAHHRELPNPYEFLPKVPSFRLTSTTVRNSPIPKVAAKKEITHEQIAERAYFIGISGQGGSEYDNWMRAERELKTGQ